MHPTIYDFLGKSKYLPHRFQIRIRERIPDLKMTRAPHDTSIYYYHVTPKQLKEVKEGIKMVRELLDNWRPFTIYLFGFDAPKSFNPTKDQHLGPENINSGVTLSYTHLPQINGTSLVFRQEELVKVAIHETLHALRFDSGPHEMPIDKEILKIIPNYNEAITEALTTLIVYSLKHNRDRKGFVRSLQQQMKHSGNLMTALAPWATIPEKTNVRAYFYLKTAYLSDPVKFMKLLESGDERMNYRHKRFQKWTLELAKDIQKKINKSKTVPRKNDRIIPIKMTLV